MYKISRSWVEVLILLRPLIWSCVSVLVQFRDAYDSVCKKLHANLGKSVTENLAVIRKAFGEESMSSTRALDWHARFRAHRKGREEGAEQNQEHIYHFLQHQRDCSQRIRPGRPKSIPYTTVMFYGYYMKMYEEFAQKFGDKKTGSCIAKTHRLSHSFPPWNF
jgi:hypothetical protein